MFDDARRVLELLSHATLPPGEGDRLLAALRRATLQPTPRAAVPVTSVRVAIQGPNGDGTHTTSLPIGLLHTGLKFASMLPGSGVEKLAAHLRQHGVNVDLSSLTREQVETLVAEVRALTIHVPAERTRVHISAE